MWTNNIGVIVGLIFTVTFFSACSENEEANVPEVIEVEAKPIKQNGVMYVPSELALIMRKMYDNMELVNTHLKAGEVVPDSLLQGYEDMLTAEATNPDEIDDHYFGFATGWLSELKVLREVPTLENYNSVMNACVHCHESFCPGPIPKIKKLKLVP
jgi:hypothetical protein